MSIGILPNVSFVKQNRVVNTGDECLFPHHKVFSKRRRVSGKPDAISTSRRATSIICYGRNNVTKHMLKSSCVYRETCCKDEFDSHSFLGSGSRFSLAGNFFNSLAIDGQNLRLLSIGQFEHG